MQPSYDMISDEMHSLYLHRYRCTKTNRQNINNGKIPNKMWINLNENLYMQCQGLTKIKWCSYDKGN